MASELNMNGQELLLVYENVAAITGQMLSAAQASNWDLLVKLEASCTSQAQVITEHSGQVQLADGERQNKARIIQQILANDRQIRDLVEPRMAKLSEMMRYSTTQTKIARAYQLDHRHSF